MKPIGVDDPLFDRQISLRDAYKILEAFLVQYNDRGESSTADLINDVGLLPSGQSADPAQLYDFLRVSGALLNDQALLDAAAKGAA